MKKLTIAIALFFISVISFSQVPELTVKSGPKGQYLEHKVAPKEGLYSIGRLYNVHPKFIAFYNKVDLNKGLAIGQVINIPLTDTNFKQTVNKGVPVYYQPANEESIANISAKSKASMSKLREWNGLTGSNVPTGTKLVIGFLVTNEMQDRVVTVSSKMNPEESVSNVKKQEASEKKQPVPETKKDVIVEESVSNVKKQESSEKKPPIPEVKKEANVEESVSNVRKQDSSEKKQPIPEVKKEVVAEESVSNVKRQEEIKKLTEPDIKKEEPKKEAEIKKEEPKKDDPVIIKQPERISDDGIGYFRSSFYQQVKTAPLSKEQTVTSSVFKTTSGWQDAKYYLLVNGVEPGTIVKITNPSNNKTVFAKVLYPMDKIRENQGVDIRISDAAASSLAVSETDKFILKLNY